MVYEAIVAPSIRAAKATLRHASEYRGIPTHPRKEMVLNVRGKALWGVADNPVMHGGLVADMSSDLTNYLAEYALRDRAMRRLKPGSIVWGWEWFIGRTPEYLRRTDLHGVGNRIPIAFRQLPRATHRLSAPGSAASPDYLNRNAAGVPGHA